MDVRRTRLLQPRNWRLGHKLGVVLAVPLLVAISLGGFRVYTQLDDAGRAVELSEQIAVTPALLDFSTVVISMATATSLGFTPQSATTDDIVDTTNTIRATVEGSNLDRTVAAQIEMLIQDGQSLYGEVSRGHVGAEERSRRSTDFLMRCRAVFRSIFDNLADHESLVGASNLLNVWDAQSNLLSEMESYRFLKTSPDAAQALAENAMNSEEATLRLLAGSSLDSGQIEGMIADIGMRRTLIRNFEPTVEFGQQLRGAVLAASTPYADAINVASEQIAGTLDRAAAEARAAAIRDLVLIAAALVLALAIGLLVARSLAVPLRQLRDGTLAAAHSDLPAAISAVKDGADIDSVQLPTIDVGTDEEIGQLSRAVDSMNIEALRLAGEQARLRKQVSVMLETLARRNKSLVEQQLSLIDSLEYQEKDPVRLQSMFALDHLAARMRRTGESLLVLAGTRPRTRTAPTLIADVLRGAVSQVENYQRIRIGPTPHGYFAGPAVNDVVHMIAELVDNALRASPPNSSVSCVLSPAVDGGLLLDIADSGIGIPRDELDEINRHLAEGDEADIDAPRQMGLYVVGRLAARNGVNVRLRPTFDSETNAGITASLYFPASMLQGMDSAAAAPMSDRPRRLPSPDGDGEGAHRGIARSLGTP